MVAPRRLRRGWGPSFSSYKLLRRLVITPFLISGISILWSIFASDGGIRGWGGTTNGDTSPPTPGDVAGGGGMEDVVDRALEGNVKDDVVVPPIPSSSIVHDGRTWKSEKSAVLSMASSSGLDDHARFVGSLRATGYDGRIILGISHDSSDDVIEYLDSKNVTYHRVYKSETGCAHNGTAGAEPMYMTYDDNGIGTPRRIIINADGTGWNCPREYPEYKLTWARFFYYRDWLMSEEDCGVGMVECADGIMVTDYRDAYFQADPFQTAVRMGLHRHPILVFEEHPNMVNTHWLTDLPVMSCKKHKVGPTPVLCSGGTMGSREGMLEYLNVMIEEFKHWMTQPDCRMQGYGDDQAVHNYLYYAGRFGDIAKAIPHRTGPIHVVGYEASNINEEAMKKAKGRGLSDVPKDFYVKYAWQRWLPEEYGLINPDTGMVVNLDGLPSAQVHQYDRFGNLIDGWLGKMKEQGWPNNNATFG
ncbi:hypothetical protein ACHAXA_010244 [Cyclostephanos tholiformis]|uniref:Uncharacterized protein n=1 Tax=Cyclostephanos tholiformis TaxID=382380 RepID=A0ABD3SG43_9STRA